MMTQGPLKFLRTSIKGAQYAEYGFVMSIGGLIAMSAAVAFSSDISRVYHEHSTTVAEINAALSGVGYVQPKPDDPADTAGPEPEPEPAPVEDTVVPFHPNRIGDCGPYNHFRYGFVENQTNVQIVVPGTIIGTHSRATNRAADPSIELSKIEAIGGPDDVFILGVEYDGVNEHFTEHNRVTVFRLNGDKVVNRALTKFERFEDLRQGDGHVIAHKRGFVIDLAEFKVSGEARFYTPDQKQGNLDFGNNDGLLSFHDIGCVIYKPE